MIVFWSSVVRQHNPSALDLRVPLYLNAFNSIRLCLIEDIEVLPLCVHGVISLRHYTPLHVASGVRENFLRMALCCSSCHMAQQFQDLRNFWKHFVIPWCAVLYKMVSKLQRLPTLFWNRFCISVQPVCHIPHQHSTKACIKVWCNRAVSCSTVSKRSHRGCVTVLCKNLLHKSLAMFFVIVLI